MNQQDASGGLEEFSLWVPKGYVMAGYPTLLEFQFMTADRPQFALGTGTEISDIMIRFTKWVLESRLVRACEEGEDYRFGFNGQEKVNEIAGLGNHTTAMFWEYDTRLGRRWNLDPKPQISISDYAANGNNPIWASDPLGDFDTRREAREYKRSNDLNGKISRGSDGLFSINDKRGGFSYTRDRSIKGEPNVLGLQSDGVLKMTMVSADRSGSSSNCYTCWLYDGRAGDNPKRASELGYMPYNPDAMGVSINYNLIGLNGGAGSLNIGIFPKSGEFGIWTTNGFAMGTPDLSVGISLFNAEYKGQGLADMQSYMGYGRGGSGGIGAFNIGFSQGLDSYDGDLIWNSYSTGLGIGGRTFTIANGQYQLFNHSRPLLRLGNSNQTQKTSQQK